MSPVRIDRSNKPLIRRGQGTTARIAVPGSPGPAGPGGSDAGVAGYVNDTASQTRAALSATYASKAPALTVLYVDPTSGNDANQGATWQTAFATIQAAVNAAPTGGRLVLAATDHDVAGGVVVDKDKALSIHGVNPLRAKQHADVGFGQTRLYSSSAPLIPAFIKIQSAVASNVFGWSFKNLYFDAGDLAVGGACIEAHAVNHAIVENCAARYLYSALGDDERYLIKADAGNGDDASWWRVVNCATKNMRGVHSTAGNYWTFSGTSFLGPTGTSPKPAGPAVYMTGAQPAFDGLHIEAFVTGIHLVGVRGANVQGVGSEWVDTLVHLDGCNDCYVSVVSSAGDGRSEVLDTNGLRNTVVGTTYVRRSGVVQGQVIQSGRMGASPLPLAPSGVYIPGIHPTLPSPGTEVLPGPNSMLDVLVGVGLTAEYWDGAAWTPWAGVETHVVHQFDLDALSIDATHKRFRLRTTSSLTSFAGMGLVYGKIGQSNGTTGTVTVRSLTGAFATVAEQTISLGDSVNAPAQVRGFLAALPQVNGAVLMEFEFDLGLTSTQTASLSRLHLWQPEAHPFNRGKLHLGRLTPEGRVTGRVGDFYLGTGTNTSADNADTGFFRKVSGTGNTGWAKAVHRARKLNTSTALDFGSIAAQTTSELTVTLTGATTSDLVKVQPQAVPPSGMLWSAYVSAANTVTVRLANVTAAAIDPPSITWQVEVESTT